MPRAKLGILMVQMLYMLMVILMLPAGLVLPLIHAHIGLASLTHPKSEILIVLSLYMLMVILMSMFLLRFMMAAAMTRVL